MRHGIPEDIGEYLQVDPSSKTGLRWIRTVNGRAKMGDEAGCKWKVSDRNRENYSVRFRNILYLNSRVIFFLNSGKDPEHLDVDHANRNSTDNKAVNLRLATVNQNQRNKKIQKNNTSGYKGVCWDKNRQKWKTHIPVHVSVFPHLSWLHRKCTTWRGTGLATKKPRSTQREI